VLAAVLVRAIVTSLEEGEFVRGVAIAAFVEIILVLGMVEVNLEGEGVRDTPELVLVRDSLTLPALEVEEFILAGGVILFFDEAKLVLDNTTPFLEAGDVLEIFNDALTELGICAEFLDIDMVSFVLFPSFLWSCTVVVGRTSFLISGRELLGRQTIGLVMYDDTPCLTSGVKIVTAGSLVIPWIFLFEEWLMAAQSLRFRTSGRKRL